MKLLFVILAAVVVVVLGIGLTFWAPEEVTAETTATDVIEIPLGYRDWKLISVAHEEGNLNDIRAVLGKDVAVRAYQERKLPFPDGAIIARLAGIAFHLRRTTRSLGGNNRLWQVLQRTSNSW